VAGNSEGGTTLESLIKEYDAMAIEDKAAINEAWDVEVDSVTKAKIIMVM